MSLHGEEQFAVRALRAGASGYLTKAAASEQLVAAIRADRARRPLHQRDAGRADRDGRGGETGRRTSGSPTASSR